jgi:hypothetical protein
MIGAFYIDEPLITLSYWDMEIHSHRRSLNSCFTGEDSNKNATSIAWKYFIYLSRCRRQHKRVKTEPTPSEN